MLFLKNRSKMFNLPMRKVGLAVLLLLICLAGEAIAPVTRIRTALAWHRLRARGDASAAAYVMQRPGGMTRLIEFAFDAHEPSIPRDVAVSVMSTEIGNQLAWKAINDCGKALDSEDETVRAGAVRLVESLAGGYWVVVRFVVASTVGRERANDDKWARIYYRLLDRCTAGSLKAGNEPDVGSRIKALHEWIRHMADREQAQDGYVIP